MKTKTKKSFERMSSTEQAAHIQKAAEKYKTFPEKLRDVGRSAVVGAGAVLVGVDKLSWHLEKRIARAAGVEEPRYLPEQRFVVNSVNRYMSTVERKRQASSARRVEHYLNKNPGTQAAHVKTIERENAEAARKSDQIKEQKIMRADRDLLNKFGELKSGRASNGFAGRIRRREAHASWSGYQDSFKGLATETLKSAAEFRQDNGSIQLLGKDIFKRRLDGAANEGGSKLAGYKAAYDQIGDVGVTLWQLGFVTGIDKKEGVTGYGSCWGAEELTTSVEDRDGVKVQITSIPFDPQNELHNLVAGERKMENGASMQIEMPLTKGYNGSYVPAGDMFVCA